MEPNLIPDLLRQIAHLNQQLPALSAQARANAGVLAAGFARTNVGKVPQPTVPMALLEAGLNPQNLALLKELIAKRATIGGGAEDTASLALIRSVIEELWQTPAWMKSGITAGLHVFIGPPGSGKTTCLCKWLSQEVLLKGSTAEVWRLDGLAANTAEFLNIQAEVLGVQVSRTWSSDTTPVAGIGFVDLPGTDWQDRTAMDSLKAQLASLQQVCVHLVLNCAYDTECLLAQLRAFSDLSVSDLIFTHLDEEWRPGKLLNFIFQRRHPLSFVSGGQNVPGMFQPITPELLLDGLAAGRGNRECEPKHKTGNGFAKFKRIL